MNDTYLEISIVNLSNLREIITMFMSSIGSSLIFCTFSWISECGDYARFWEASDWLSDFVILQSKIDGSQNMSDYIVAGDVLLETIIKQTTMY